MKVKRTICICNFFYQIKGKKSNLIESCFMLTVCMSFEYLDRKWRTFLSGCSGFLYINLKKKKIFSVTASWIQAFFSIYILFEIYECQIYFGHVHFKLRNRYYFLNAKFISIQIIQKCKISL